MEDADIVLGKTNPRNAVRSRRGDLKNMNLSSGDLVRIVDYEPDEETFESNYGKVGVIVSMIYRQGEPVYQVLVDDRTLNFYEDMIEKV